MRDFGRTLLMPAILAKTDGVPVLVQREMESGRSLFAGIWPFRGPSLEAPPKAVVGQA